MPNWQSGIAIAICGAVLAAIGLATFGACAVIAAQIGHAKAMPLVFIAVAGGGLVEIGRL